MKEKLNFDCIVASLQEEAINTIGNLLSQMLAWDPAERPSAEDALGHPCFASLTSANPQIRQKRDRSPSISS